ncbi:epoxyqueuosine reductase QueH [Clostridium sp. MB40-C1]|uniref:epoxyqueuosine reductase QueH n=1 Tax=Clostridium sp. MB40-C1 TaxID=3070996 RepID=UPI0027E20F5C|nr:epoxyqueuosine reductase QueH [Clostridium sp. MB40-C1]WMJ79870.1 epoxyqueuosine reductase QueH [Clostridium sp. MB40-C1]
MKVNYQKILDKKLEEIKALDKVPSLLLHSCCAPCSSYVLEYLSEFFNITIFYYNPNIHPENEYRKRVQEQKEFISQLPTKTKINFIEGNYNTQEFFNITKGLEEEREGGTRCFKCYELRLREAAKKAKELNFDYFTTVLSISPHKNSEKINEIGEKLAEEFNIKFLNSDFKKKNGYKRSIELSKEYNLYRQNYCGCVYSQRNLKTINEK